jgi:hypothetical protein
MPALPLHVAEPLTAVLGVMLYPADEDSATRDCWEALTLARPLGQLQKQRAEVDAGLVNWVLSHSGPYTIDQKDLGRRWANGSMTGELVKVLIWLTHRHPELASWNKASQWLEAMDQKGFTRSTIYDRKAQFLRVAHLWGAYSVNGQKMDDLQSFLALSEQIRIWGQSWRRKAHKSEPLLGHDMWIPPKWWKHPDPDWPDQIKIPAYELVPLGSLTPSWLPST